MGLPKNQRIFNSRRRASTSKEELPLKSAYRGSKSRELLAENGGFELIW
jgi:hypothetical protein